MEVRRINNDELYHHGIKGQKWGVRRYQNADGSLTAAGRARYAKEFSKVVTNTKPDPNSYYVKTEHADYARNPSVKAMENTKIGSIISKDPKLNKLKDNVIKEKKRYEESIKDYHNNEEKWVKEALPKYYRRTFPQYKNKSDKELLDEYYDFWMYDDGDQGQSFAYYLSKTGKSKDYLRYEKAHYDYVNAVGERALELFGDIRVKNQYGRDTSITKLVEDVVEDYNGVSEYERWDPTYFDEKDFKRK